MFYNKIYIKNNYIFILNIVFIYEKFSKVTVKGKQLPTRIIVLLEDSGSDVVTCTLWSDQSSGYYFKENDAMFVKNNKVNIYNGVKGVTCFSEGSVTKQDDKRAIELSTWCIHGC